MPNMPYCRFTNTADALQDCVDNLRSLDRRNRHFNTDEERDARARIIFLAAVLLEEIGVAAIPVHVLEGAIAELDAEEVGDAC